METILCIPGKWGSKEDAITAIADANVDEFICTESLMVSCQTEVAYSLEIVDRQEGMKNSFRIAGAVNHLSEEFLNEIDEHRFVVYLIGETGSMQTAVDIAEAGYAILLGGGIGIKVETTGKAFTKDQWSNLVEEFEEANLYKMYVIDSINNGDTTFTCGMHNLGLKDTIVSNEPFETANHLLSVFGYYQIIDKPTIKLNNTFAIAADEPKYTILDEPAQPYKGDQFFENPYGMWRLQKKDVVVNNPV